MKKYAITLLAIALAACNTDTNKATHSIQPAPATSATVSTNATAASNTQAPRAAGLWIDVRSPEEFQAGHLRDAVNIPVEQVAANIASVAPDKNAPINVYCRSGRRSEIALQELKKLGYTNVTNQGGYQDLLNKGIQ
ncbi:rhodanese-like domain-containing protein [Neisseriaceae bacterium B1]